MKKRIQQWLLDVPGFEAFCRILTRRHVRAVMYHRFCDDATGNPRFVDRETLRQQARYLARHHTPWTPDRHLAALQRTDWPGGRCPVVITADDGYADFARIAHPVFQDAGLPTMLFVATDFVDGKIWFWWDQIEHLFASARGQRILVDLGGSQVELDLTHEAARQRAWHRTADHCRFLPDGEKNALIARLADRLECTIPTAPPADYAAVTWDQVTVMARSGALFGAHTRRHPILSRVPLDEAEREIFGSQDRLAEMLGRPVSWFCYPQGGPADWTPAVRELVSRRFDGCYLAYQSLDDPGDAFTMPRYCVSRDMTEFRWSLCGASYLVLRLRRLLGMSTGVGPSYWSGQP